MNAELVNKFSSLKLRRDQAQQRYIAADARVSSARDRYQAVMAEVNGLGIGSYDELNAKISALSAAIAKDLELFENQIFELEVAEREATSEKASNTSIG